jgi:hypothetical protein
MRRLYCRQIHPALFAIVALLAATPHSGAQAAPATHAAQESTRPCSANPVLAPSAKKKSPRKGKHLLPPEASPACIEVKGEPIEVQEFLQSFAREQQWRVGENHASEDTWSFVRYLNTEELEKYADTKVLLEAVKFSSGKSAVAVRTSDAGNGYVRVQITARFQGEGKSEDKMMAQPGNIWTLASRGVIEQELLSTLQSRYKHTE